MPQETPDDHVFSDGNGLTIEKGCAADERGKQPACFGMRVGQQDERQLCMCDTDFCNAASSSFAYSLLKGTLFVLFVSLFL